MNDNKLNIKKNIDSNLDDNIVRYRWLYRLKIPSEVFNITDKFYSDEEMFAEPNKDFIVIRLDKTKKEFKV